MHDSRLTRRGFMARGVIAATGAVVAGSLIGCGGNGPATQNVTTSQQAYILSGRGRRVSNAALSHNHSMRFVSAAAADACRAHAGDTSKVVTIDISAKQWQAWFGSGATKVDLRHA